MLGKVVGMCREDSKARGLKGTGKSRCVTDGECQPSNISNAGCKRVAQILIDRPDHRHREEKYVELDQLTGIGF